MSNGFFCLQEIPTLDKYVSDYLKCTSEPSLTDFLQKSFDDGYQRIYSLNSLQQAFYRQMTTPTARVRRETSYFNPTHALSEAIDFIKRPENNGNVRMSKLYSWFVSREGYSNLTYSRLDRYLKIHDEAFRVDGFPKMVYLVGDKIIEKTDPRQESNAVILNEILSFLKCQEGYSAPYTTVRSAMTRLIQKEKSDCARPASVFQYIVNNSTEIVRIDNNLKLSESYIRKNCRQPVNVNHYSIDWKSVFDNIKFFVADRNLTDDNSLNLFKRIANGGRSVLCETSNMFLCISKLSAFREDLPLLGYRDLLNELYLRLDLFLDNYYYQKEQQTLSNRLRSLGRDSYLSDKLFYLLEDDAFPGHDEEQIKSISRFRNRDVVHVSLFNNMNCQECKDMIAKVLKLELSMTKTIDS